jgi:hypothetical protein
MTYGAIGNSRDYGVMMINTMKILFCISLIGSMMIFFGSIFTKNLNIRDKGVLSVAIGCFIILVTSGVAVLYWQLILKNGV